jgi:LysR family transcriptional regulator, hydrogen peroxide-inducible genes activator
MELHEIRYFLALCKTLNFTKAAELCHVSQPALTRAIQKLEDELGGLLFSRERSNTHLTDLGRLLEPQLAQVLERTQAAKESASRFLRLDGAQLSIGVMCTIGPMRFVSFLNRFRVDNPGIEVTLLEAVPDRLGDMLVKGELDVAIMSRPGGFAPPLKGQVLYTERFMIACSAGHKFARRNAVPMAELDGQTYLSRINCEYRDFLAEQCAENGARLVRSFRSEREDWILTMVAAGMGVCFLPEFSATLPGLIARLIVSPAVAREVCLVTVAGRRWSAPLATFAQAIQRYRWPEPEPDASEAQEEIMAET